MTEGGRLTAGRIALVAFAALTGVFLLAPTVVAFLMAFTDEQSFRFPPPRWSFRFVHQFFNDPTWTSAFSNSVKVALLTAAVASVCGTLAAFALQRSRIPGKSLIWAVILSPMIVPVLAYAVGIYALFLRWHLAGTTQGFVAAHLVVALPPVIILVSASMRTFDRRLEDAAASLGAGPVVTFFRVTLPLIYPGLVGGAVFAFLASWGEPVISLYLSDTFMQTLPPKILQSIRYDNDPTLAVAAALTQSVTLVLLLVVVILQRRRARVTR